MPRQQMLFHAFAKMNFSDTIRLVEQPEANLNVENVVNQPVGVYGGNMK